MQVEISVLGGAYELICAYCKASGWVLSDCRLVFFRLMLHSVEL